MSERNNIPPVDEQGRVNWAASIDRFSDLHPHEIVALSRLESVYWVTEYLDRLVREKRDAGRLTAVMSAFLDSPLPQDRMVLANGASFDLIRAGHHGLGMTMWDRLIRDEDVDVRTHAYNHVEEILQGSIPRTVDESWPDPFGPQGFYAVTHVDEQDLLEHDGLSRQDAYNLTLSHAYAENGDYFNLGRAALAKLQASQPPTS